VQKRGKETREKRIRKEVEKRWCRREEQEKHRGTREAKEDKQKRGTRELGEQQKR
jgi:hypothetical protein